jgi:peptidyl-prolyl cis-trans isomerase C
MKTRSLWTIALASALFTAPVFAETQGQAPEDKVLLTVNGYEVTTDVLLAYRSLRQRPAPRDPEQAYRTLLNELATILMISQDAEARGVDKKPEHAAMLDVGRRMALSEAAVQDVLISFEVSDEAIQTAYDEKYKDMPKEYKARHILVKEEDKAKELIAELDGGADFAELATEHSADPGSAARGGDLGWFTPERMVKPFSEAVVAQEPGVYSKEPIKSQFGYHILVVEETRDQEPPKLEDVREELGGALRQQAVSDYVASLSTKAEIKLMDPPAPADGQASEGQTGEAKN